MNARFEIGSIINHLNSQLFSRSILARISDVEYADGNSYKSTDGNIVEMNTSRINYDVPVGIEDELLSHGKSIWLWSKILTQIFQSMDLDVLVKCYDNTIIKKIDNKSHSTISDWNNLNAFGKHGIIIANRKYIKTLSKAPDDKSIIKAGAVTIYILDGMDDSFVGIDIFIRHDDI